ncbi:MAG: hypothetical protein R3E52_11960 [Burkholderiaceae bacterium]
MRWRATIGSRQAADEIEEVRAVLALPESDLHGVDVFMLVALSTLVAPEYPLDFLGPTPGAVVVQGILCQAIADFLVVRSSEAS